MAMATSTFDTLKYANTLKAAGVPDKQAEAQASVLGEALTVNFKDLALKDDLTATVAESEGRLNVTIRETEQRLVARITELDQRLTGKINELDQRLSGKINELDQRLTGKIAEVDQRLNAKITELDQRLSGKIENLGAKIDGQITLVKWMIGLSISLNVAVLVRLFFVRLP